MLSWRTGARSARTSLRKAATVTQPFRRSGILVRPKILLIGASLLSKPCVWYNGALRRLHLSVARPRVRLIVGIIGALLFLPAVFADPARDPVIPCRERLEIVAKRAGGIAKL